MRKYLALVTVLLGGGVALVAASPATANNAAVVINGTTCGLIDGNGMGVTTDASHAVITSSGHANVICKAMVTPSSTGHAVSFNFANTGGGLCGTEAGPTSNWNETVSASGNATLSCHFSS